MKVLITAGATWIKIDAVRIITNRFSGRTGYYLWQQLKKKGHAVTLLINPHCIGRIKGRGIVSYHYFDEFDKALRRLLQRNRYDAIIHMAAISDYRLKKALAGKIPSGRRTLLLRLTPTEKIIHTVRKLAPHSLLIQFKLEPYRRGLINRAYRSLISNRSSFVVANALEDLRRGYKAFLVDRDRNVVPIRSQASLAKILHEIIDAACF